MRARHLVLFGIWTQLRGQAGLLTFSADHVKEIHFRQRVVLRTVDDGQSPPTKQQDPKKNTQLLKRFMKFYVCKVKLASHVITTISYYLSPMPPIRYFKHRYSKKKRICPVIENKKWKTSNMFLSSKTGPLHNYQSVKNNIWMTEQLAAYSRIISHSKFCSRLRQETFHSVQPPTTVAYTHFTFRCDSDKHAGC